MKFLHYTSVVLAAFIFMITLSPSSGAEETNASPSPRLEDTPVSLMFVVDCSQNMKEMAGGATKFELAKDLVQHITDKMEKPVNAGLICFGHRTEDTCDDIELLVPLGKIDKEKIEESLGDVMPKGKSCIASALKSAAEHLKEAPGMRDIILITDGNMNCEGNLIETARQIKEDFDYSIRFDILGISPSRSDQVTLYVSAAASRGTSHRVKKPGDVDTTAKAIATLLDNLTQHVPRTVRQDDMVLIPAGEFSMGCDRDKLGWVTEQPVHSVYLDAFYMDTYEVTQKQYRDVMGKNRSFWIGSDLPVENLTWFEAKEYCEKVGKRLPTEAEWEKASKGGADDTWAGTSNRDEIDGFCWIDDTGAEGMTHPVGLKKPNGYGLYDMCGNVREWVADWYHDRYYKESPSKNPPGPEKGYTRIMRGGEWDNHLYESRSCSRHTMAPDLKYGNTGFRCVRSAEGENGKKD